LVLDFHGSKLTAYHNAVKRRGATAGGRQPG